VSSYAASIQYVLANIVEAWMYLFTSAWPQLWHSSKARAWWSLPCLWTKWYTYCYTVFLL